MTRIRITLVIAVLIGFLSGPALGQDDPVETISRKCHGELARFCGEVSPGRSRILACLYAHSDKLTAACGLALIDATPQLNRQISNLALVAAECGGDLRKYCSLVDPGEGRLADCLNRNGDKVSAGCKDALKAGGLNRF